MKPTYFCLVWLPDHQNLRISAHPTESIKCFLILDSYICLHNNISVNWKVEMWAVHEILCIVEAQTPLPNNRLLCQWMLQDHCSVAEPAVWASRCVNGQQQHTTGLKGTCHETAWLPVHPWPWKKAWAHPRPSLKVKSLWLATTTTQRQRGANK